MLEDCDLFKVPYSMKKVSSQLARGFSGENPGDELATEISSIKTVQGNATLKVQDALKGYKGFVLGKLELKYERLQIKLKSAACCDNKF